MIFSEDAHVNEKGSNVLPDTRGRTDQRKSDFGVKSDISNPLIQVPGYQSLIYRRYSTSHSNLLLDDTNIKSTILKYCTCLATKPILPASFSLTYDEWTIIKNKNLWLCYISFYSWLFYGQYLDTNIHVFFWNFIIHIINITFKNMF